MSRSHKNDKSAIWSTDYSLTPKAGAALMEIAAAKTMVDSSPLPLPQVEEVRRRARLRAVHFSTKMAGNRLSLEDVERVIADHEAGKTRQRLSSRRKGRR